MLKRVFVLAVLGLVLASPRYVRAQDDPDFCYTGWYEISREADGECDRVIYYCDVTHRAAIEYDCTGGYGMMY